MIRYRQLARKLRIHINTSTKVLKDNFHPEERLDLQISRWTVLVATAEAKVSQLSDSGKRATKEFPHQLSRLYREFALSEFKTMDMTMGVTREYMAWYLNSAAIRDQDSLERRKKKMKQIQEYLITTFFERNAKN